MRKPVRWLLSIAFALTLVWLFWPKPEAPRLAEAVKSISPDVSPQAPRESAARTPIVEVAPGVVPPDDDADARGLAALEANAVLAERSVERFCEENKRVSSVLHAMPDAGTRADSSAFFSSRIGWADKPGSLQLATPLSTAMNDGAWRSFSSTQLEGLDFSWMKELLAYDHWSLQNTAAFRDARGGLLEVPMPDYATLQRWAKLRMVKGLIDDDLVEATTEVLHLAMLIGSSGTALASMIQVSIVGIIDSVWQQAKRAPPVPFPNDEERTHAKRTLLASYHFLLPRVSMAVRTRAWNCMADPCAALAEAVNLNATAGDVENVKWLLARNQCDAALAQRVAKVEPRGPRIFADGEPPENGIASWLASLDGGME